MTKFGGFTLNKIMSLFGKLITLNLMTTVIQQLPAEIPHVVKYIAQFGISIQRFRVLRESFKGTQIGPFSPIIGTLLSMQEITYMVSQLPQLIAELKAFRYWTGAPEEIDEGLKASARGEVAPFLG